MTKAVVALATLLVLLALPSWAGAQGATDAPNSTLVSTGRLVIDTIATTTGPARVVKLEGWPKGPVTISLCGNEARRASADCDLASAFAAVVPETGNVVAILPAGNPPVGCPCVVRVTTNGNDFVRATPIDLPGVPVLTPEQRSGPLGAIPSAAQLTVVAQLVTDPDESFGDRTLAWFGGAARRTLVLTVRNAAGAPMRNLTATAAIGPSASSGASIALPPVGSLAPGEERVLRVAVTVPAPAIGTFRAHGTIFGMETPVAFDAPTESRPWGVAVLGLVMLLVAARGIARRWRRRRQRKRSRDAAQTSERARAPAHGDVGQHQTTPPNARETVGEQRVGAVAAREGSRHDGRHVIP